VAESPEVSSPSLNLSQRPRFSSQQNQSQGYWSEHRIKPVKLRRPAAKQALERAGRASCGHFSDSEGGEGQEHSTKPRKTKKRFFL
jgi:hypothetical protein